MLATYIRIQHGQGNKLYSCSHKMENRIEFLRTNIHDTNKNIQLYEDNSTVK